EGPPTNSTSALSIKAGLIMGRRPFAAKNLAPEITTDTEPKQVICNINGCMFASASYIIL
ncbi:hypothetical protein SARC_17634, partial [Sphaeroforma arctica JP610]